MFTSLDIRFGDNGSNDWMLPKKVGISLVIDILFMDIKSKRTWVI
jgi:hypothetical protein